MNDSCTAGGSAGSHMNSYTPKSNNPYIELINYTNNQSPYNKRYFSNSNKNISKNKYTNNSVT